VSLGEQVGQLVGGRTERYDEGQVEQQLERSRRAVLLGGVASPHASPVVAAVLDHCGSLGTARARRPSPPTGSVVSAWWAGAAPRGRRRSRRSRSSPRARP
jgi:hypothetical protein